MLPELYGLDAGSGGFDPVLWGFWSSAFEGQGVVTGCLLGFLEFVGLWVGCMGLERGSGEKVFERVGRCSVVKGACNLGFNRCACCFIHFTAGVTGEFRLTSGIRSYLQARLSRIAPRMPTLPACGSQAESSQFRKTKPVKASVALVLRWRFYCRGPTSSEIRRRSERKVTTAPFSLTVLT